LTTNINVKILRRTSVGIQGDTYYKDEVPIHSFVKKIVIIYIFYATRNIPTLALFGKLHLADLHNCSRLACHQKCSEVPIFAMRGMVRQHQELVFGVVSRPYQTNTHHLPHLTILHKGVTLIISSVQGFSKLVQTINCLELYVTIV